MKNKLVSFGLVALTAGGAFFCAVPRVKADPAIGLTVDNALIQFDTATPATLTSGPTTVSGLQAGETLLGIDRRPANGQIYALGSTGRIYTLNTVTGAATQVSILSADPADATNPFASLSGSEFGIDFNPVPDRLRVVSDTDQNLRINVDTGLVTTDAPLAFAAGDTNAGDDPIVTASAYTNSFSGATATTLYGIDVTNHVLVTQNPPNNGTLNTVGSLLISDSIEISGFDIAPGSNDAFGTFTSASLPTASYLYQIDLGTGTAAAIDQIGPSGTGRVRGLTLLPASTVRFSAATYSINEDGGSILVPVFRIGNTDAALTVDYATNDGSATSGFDYQPTSGTLSFAPGETIKTIPIQIVSSPIAENDETFTVTLSNIDLNNDGAALESPSTATVTIVDGSSAAANPPAVTIYAVTINNALFSFPSDDPTAVSNIVAITGLKTGEKVLGIDVRPATGQLYGLGSGSRLYLINPQTGAATQVGSDGSFTLSGNEFGFDFNPVPDRIRVTSDTGQNLRLNPNDGTLSGTDNPLAYDTNTGSAGTDTADVNAGVTPSVVGSGYSNPDNDPATGTSLYGIDSNTDTLFIQNPPNNGTLLTVGPLGVDVSSRVGFDITPANVAFLASSSAGTNGFYSVNLSTGQTASLGPIAFPDSVRGIAVAAPTPDVTPAQAVDLSARAFVQTDDDVAIGGFIIRGTVPKQVIVRGIGSSLQVGGNPVPGRLADPTITLYEANGATIEVNDDWQQSPNAAAIQSAGLAPSNPKESAIKATLDPGSYTVILRGVNMTTGVGLVEIYDIDGMSDSQFANISSRAFVSTGDSVLINGLILRGTAPQQILFRAIGPDLGTERGIADSLQNPTMELFNSNGTSLGSNDDWRSTQETQITATGIPPHDDRDSAILIMLGAGNYTTVIRGQGNSTGVALGEVYNLGAP
jgi:Domain of unknown function (DUF4394)/Calx-beta domain